MKTVKVNIQNGADRNNMVIALANAKCRVWVEVAGEEYGYTSVTYWVCFEIPDNNIKQ